MGLFDGNTSVECLIACNTMDLFIFPSNLKRVHTLPQWTVQFLSSDRKLQVGMGSAPHRALVRISQDLVLLPIFFNIFNYDILTHPKVTTANKIALAVTYCTTGITQHLGTLPNWYDFWRFRINEEKSEGIRFFEKNPYQA